MCARYHPVTQPDRFQHTLGTGLPPWPDATTTPPAEVFPQMWAPVLRATSRAQDTPGHEAVWGRFGLVPPGAADTRIGRHTYNARSETVATRPSYQAAWARYQHCLVPAEAITEPEYLDGRAHPRRIRCADGLPMGIAGLWSEWHDPHTPEAHPLISFTMLTIPAAGHGVMDRFHRPGDEKRMVLILPRSLWTTWLFATPQTLPPNQRRALFQRYPAQRLTMDAREDHAPPSV